MGSIDFFKRLFLACSLTTLSFQVAASPAQPEQQADKIINQLYHNLNNLPKSDMSSRLKTISQYFLGKPYLLGALGEGSKGQYDQSPLYRADAFDCETYVDTVLAIALAPNPLAFKQCINKIRYKQGLVAFTTRNHFTDLDWNKNNQKQAFVKDITSTFHDEKNQPVAKIASALINKPAWYQHFTKDNIHLSHADEAEKINRLDALKREGNLLESTVSTIPYIPLTALFKPSGKANDYLFKQIPNGAIIEIIRPNWDLRQQIGTCLNVSHLGFTFWDNDKLLFHQASSAYGRTVDVDLIDYLRNAQKSPTIKGINVQIVLPKYPLERC